ncbi:MAG TPA: hypothetical protein VF117_00065 [Gammaproteobacteria bacterium]
MANADQAVNRQFRRDIVLVLVLKALGLYLLWSLFFSAPHQVHPTPGTTAQQLLGASAVSSVQTSRQVP